MCFINIPDTNGYHFQRLSFRPAPSKPRVLTVHATVVKKEVFPIPVRTWTLSVVRILQLEMFMLTEYVVLAHPYLMAFLKMLDTSPASACIVFYQFGNVAFHWSVWTFSKQYSSILNVSVRKTM